MYEFTESMREISGFGGGYEQACRDMLKAGLEWLDKHPKATPKYKGLKGVFGLCIEDNEDADRLSNVVVDGAGEYGPTGAMHQAVIGSIFYIREHGWDKYVEAMSKKVSA